MRAFSLLLINFSLLLHRAVSINIISLKENWFLQNEQGVIQISGIKIPNGIYSALHDAKITEDILYSYNDVKLRDYGKKMNWTYSTRFGITDKELDHEHIILTFHGLDTVAEIYLNNEFLEKTDNMFRRYRFDVKSILKENENMLEIRFQSPVEAAKRLYQSMERKIPPPCPPKNYHGECHMNMLRKMQASFAWDWGLAAPSMGIWKDVEIEFYDSLNIRDITYDLSVAPNKICDQECLWNLKFRIYLESGKEKSKYQGNLNFELSKLIDPFKKTYIFYTDKNGQSVIDLEINVRKAATQLWWPNGYGSQKLYTFKVKWEDERTNDIDYYNRTFLTSEKSINVGFRTIELIQNLMDNGLSFYFRVNNIPIFMKGSNWIPAHILPENTANEEKIKELLLATRDANMNMLRVWGGGVYESDYFYNLADKYGILIWQDMMFACAMYPATPNFLNSVRHEIREQIQRIQHHPSIALFATNNENEVALRQNWYGTTSDYEEFAKDYKKLYVDTIVDEIRNVDQFRKVITSSPSNGDWQKDRDAYGISQDPQSAHFGDIHFYPTSTNSWLSTTFHTARFASEYGFQSYPCGWKEVAPPGNDNIIDLINHRQHHPLNNTLIAYLIQDNLKVEFESLNWMERVYLSQVSQALALKTETEVYRRGRGEFMQTMGALYWQLNDVWVAPSWSSIELNGNYKIVHYYMTNVFASLALITQLGLLNKLTINIVSDEINVKTKPMTVRMDIHKWSELEVVASKQWNFNVQPNDVQQVDSLNIYTYMFERGFDIYEYLLMFYIYDDNDMNNPVATNFVFPANYNNLKGITDPKIQFELSPNKCENDLHQISITINVKSPALFVYITLDHEDIKKYKLSKNGFIQVEPITSVQLSFVNVNCNSIVTENSLNIMTLNKYL